MTIQQELERYRGDAVYIQEHREQLLKEYPEEWIAVLDLKIVGHSGDLDALLRELDSSGIPRGEACIKHLTTKPPRTVVVRL